MCIESKCVTCEGVGRSKSVCALGIIFDRFVKKVWYLVLSMWTCVLI